MPRMRGLSDVTLYRPAKSIRYEHIDALFTGDLDWELIATHARDMIQVVLSIQRRRHMFPPIGTNNSALSRNS